MDIHLVVVRPFGTHAKGDVITDGAVISEVLAAGHAHDVVRVLASDSGKGG